MSNAKAQPTPVINSWYYVSTIHADPYFETPFVSLWH